MSTESKSKPVRWHSVFGLPPLLDNEDEAAYDELLGRVCAAVKPADVIDEMLIGDVVFLELDVLRGRRWKLSRIQERGFEALEDFLRQKLDYKCYRERFADDLTEILQSNVPTHRAEDYAPMLARACAQNQSAAVDEVNKILDRIGQSLDYLLYRAQAAEAQELTQQYWRREPATVKFIDEVLAAAGRSVDSFMAEALRHELDFIERLDRLIANAENRRDASLREIDRRRAVLGQKVRKSLQEVEDSQVQVIEAAPALQPKETNQLGQRPQD